jgi:exopolysaccharide production protein ExoQ
LNTIALVVGLVLAAVLPTVGLMNGPVYAPLIFVAGVAGLAALRRTAQADRPLLVMAGLFALWSWLGLLWSISAHRTVEGALQATLVFPASLAFLAACRLYPAGQAGRLATVLAVAACAGMALILSDALDGYHVLHAVEGAKTWPTKYNRGIDHSFLILLPVIAFARAQKRWLTCLAAIAALGITILAGHNMTAQVALPAVLGVAALASFAPWLTAGLLGAATVAEALALPFLMPLINRLRPAIAPHLKISGVERLEIWDYLSAHALQHPLLGWGLWTSRLLPATAAEKATFIKATGSGIYPHNQFLELWVELGLPGVLIGLAFALLVLRRITCLPPSLRGEAFAAYGVALAVASSGFEVTTDSWWAALAACAALFCVFTRALQQEDVVPQRG